MDYYPSFHSSVGNAHQVSVNTDTAALRRQRGFVWRVVAVTVGLMISMGGTRLLVEHTTRQSTLLGVGVVLMGLAPTGWMTVRLARRLRRMRRVHLDLCARCGYPTKGVRKGKCPECGKDPFEVD